MKRLKIFKVVIYNINLIKFINTIKFKALNLFSIIKPIGYLYIF